MGVVPPWSSLCLSDRHLSACVEWCVNKQRTFSSAEERTDSLLDLQIGNWYNAHTFLPASHVTHPGIPLIKSAALILSNDWDRSFYAQEY